MDSFTVLILPPRINTGVLLCFPSPPPPTFPSKTGKHSIHTTPSS